MLKINELNSLYLGVQGENLARTLQIDVSDWLAGHPNASMSLWHKINGADSPTATGATLDLETGILSWSPTSTDTAHEGIGEAEIRLTESNVIKKTRKIQTLTSPSVTLNGSETGSGWQEYINTIEALKNAAVQAKNRAEEIVGDMSGMIAEDLLDDTAGDGNIRKTWSADKLVNQFALKAAKTDVNTEMAKRTKYTEIFAGCTEYTPAQSASFTGGVWYHETGSGYICKTKNDWEVNMHVTTGVYHLPTSSNEMFDVYSIAAMIKHVEDTALAAAEEAKEEAEAAASAANGLYIDADGDLCQGPMEV